jgi:arylsulfatase A-like enzyme
MKTIREQYGTSQATPEIWAEIKATYFGVITRLGDQFGRVIKKLDDLNLFDDTVTMFFTDQWRISGIPWTNRKVAFWIIGFSHA